MKSIGFYPSFSIGGCHKTIPEQVVACRPEFKGHGKKKRAMLYVWTGSVGGCHYEQDLSEIQIKEKTMGRYP